MSYKPVRRLNANFTLAVNTGFTLIEVLIGLALALIAMVVVLQVFAVSNSRKSVIVGGAEAQQIASVASFQMGRMFRIGGSGFMNARSVIGCPITATRFGTILPASAVFPAPFSAVNQTIRVIPVLVYPGSGANGSDVLVTISDNSEIASAEFDLEAVPALTSISVKNSNGVRKGDFLLATNPVDPLTDSPAECKLAQVDTTFAAYDYAAGARLATATVLPLGTSSPYNTSGALTTFPLATRMLNLGQNPAFHLYGIGANNRLLQRDMLQPASAVSAVMAENIVDFRVIYGVDTDEDGALDSWVAPTGTWSPATLSAGTPAASKQIKQILAIRTALVVRSTEIAADAEPQTAYVMFGDIAALRVNESIATNMQKRRHQVFESVVPLRNLRLPQPTLGL